MLKPRRCRRTAAAPRARGVALIEALVAIIVFSIGLVGLLGMQAEAATRERDALYRAEAAALAGEIIGTLGTDRANAAGYAHRAAGSVCNPSGASATNANAVRWLNSFTTAGAVRFLPGATADKQQIVVDTTVTPPLVRVNLCWQAPQDGSPRTFTAVARLP